MHFIIDLYVYFAILLLTVIGQMKCKKFAGKNELKDIKAT